MKILVIDYHPLFREGLRYLLQGLGEDIEIVEAESFERACEFVSAGKSFDLVLADPSMPKEDGFAGLSELRDRLGDAPIVVISGLEDRSDVLRALACGVKGYIPKSTNSEVMLSALRLVFAGGVYLPPALLAETGAGAPSERGLAESAPAAAPRVSVAALTPRQLDVLAHLGEGKSNREIARDLGLAEGTVKVHVTAILEALGVKNRTQAVLAAAEAGRAKV